MTTWFLILVGRAVLKGSWDEIEEPSKRATFKRASGMIDLTAQTEEEMEAIRKVVVQKEGLLFSLFDVLRRVPRRVLMVFKLNDLTRYVRSAIYLAVYLRS